MEESPETPHFYATIDNTQDLYEAIECHFTSYHIARPDNQKLNPDSQLGPYQSPHVSLEVTVAWTNTQRTDHMKHMRQQRDCNVFGWIHFHTYFGNIGEVCIRRTKNRNR